MNQPVLFEVPKDTPSHKERLEAFKKKVGIWTNAYPGESTREFPKWTAMLLPFDGNGKERYSDHRDYCTSDEPLSIIAGYCRVIQETGRCDYGHTECEAIENLCQENGIQFVL